MSFEDVVAEQVDHVERPARGELSRWEDPTIGELRGQQPAYEVTAAIVSRMGELVERVDERDRVLGVVDRAEAERRRWMHRIATTICRDPMRRILVLRRAEQHTRFPGHYDVMVGGAVDVGESYEDAAARELSEELGADVLVRFMFKFLCRDGVSPVWFGVHEAVITEPLVPDPSEIAWHAWLTELELREVVDRWPFVPGGREALRRYSVSGNEGRPSAG
ncbi:NUDIX domain-containing protein [Nonomuraea sp. NPDC050202]|uniref:NUDIX hydrolase n=1 Tax=Nonomuraea sp. NPDC050202 TaxID=3155035 RepID=UPI0034098FBE